jgi:flagellar hook-associated protein FlgK
MSSVFSIGLSGLQAAQASLDLSARRIAESGTPGLQRQRLVLQAAETGGVRADLAPDPGPGEDLANDLVSQRQALALYSANLRTVQTADQLLGALLDDRA